MTHRPEGKRIGPPTVEPLRFGHLRIEALHWGRERGLGQNGGYLRAVDAETGDEAWTLRVYRIDYDPHLEDDVQDIFIRSIEPSGTDATLLVTDERGRRYSVDLPEGTVAGPDES